MQIINADSHNAERDALIAAESAKGRKGAAIAREYRLGAQRVRTIIRTYRAQVDYLLTLTDGTQEIPIAIVKTNRGFLRACQCAVTAYSGTFANLELTCWRLKSGAHEVKLKELSAALTKELKTAQMARETVELRNLAARAEKRVRK